MKRKFDNIEDSDSEEPSFGKQILPVADLPDDFDGEPMDGMQYLFTVRRGAKALPQFTRVANPFESAAESLPIRSSTQQGPHPALPSAEWRELSETRWKNYHKNFNQPTIGTSFPVSGRKLMPDEGERDLWWAFLSGKPESIWGQPRQSKKKKAKRQRRHDEFAEGTMRTPAPPDDIGLSVAMEVSADHAVETFTRREPTPQLLKLIDERTALRLLMYFTFWIHRHLREPDSPSYQLTETHARWIFSLLLCIGDYISADDMNLLRNLARACLALVKVTILGLPSFAPSKAETSIEQARQTRAMGQQAGWIIIAGIVGIWGQRDLWMDVEDAFASLG
ncbi:hypothetical protein AN958_05475 [Leucoagaricus sp. SymC.cos]|nr:hypothetical protein AN958_05475 [Leucoagaricus sp. SymC.cos]